MENSPPEFVTGVKKFQRLVFNISGEIFETTEDTLRRFPTTLLGQLHTRIPYFCSKTQQYFFNRSRICFDSILYFYQSNGRLNCPPGMSLRVFEEECEFFKIPKFFINKMKEECGIILTLQRNPQEKSCSSSETLKEKIWNFCEYPETSSAALTFRILSMIAIFLAVIGPCLETLPCLNPFPNTLQSNPWQVLDLVLNSWFLIEILLRFLSTPSKTSFLKGWLNWIDILVVFPYFFLLAFNPGNMKKLSFLRIFRLGRSVRLFRLSKHSIRLRVAGYLFKSYAGDLQLLTVCLFLMVFFCGSVVFFIENFNRISPDFDCIPNALWWGLITITNVGYGDIVPETPAGKLFAGIFMLTGVITLSLPLLSLVVKFVTYYERNVNPDKPVKVAANWRNNRSNDGANKMMNL